jgi:small subunit ribosomal protein S6
MQKSYELMVLLHPDLEIDAEAPIAKIEALVNDAGGKVTRRDNWGKKRLAYRISHQDFAIYVYFELLLPPTKVRELENTLLITEEVLRHLLVVHEVAPPRQPDKAGADKPAEIKKPEAADEPDEKSEGESKTSQPKAAVSEEGAQNG